MNDAVQTPGRAVIFGATGGIGAALVAALADRGWWVLAGSRSGKSVLGASDTFAFDLADETSIVAAADAIRANPPRLVIVATGALTLADGTGPEKSFRQLDPDAMAEAFRINVIGPALIAKHMLPLLPREGRSVFAALGARVGSIGDNRLGGWHSYRASKAALAMLVRNFGIELARTHPKAVVSGLHPGTVDTPLSALFQSRMASDALFAPATAAKHLLDVIQHLGPTDSGKVFDWQGIAVPP